MFMDWPDNFYTKTFLEEAFKLYVKFEGIEISNLISL